MPGRSRAKAFYGCHAVVTGAARGIGEAIAENLAEKGAEVLIADLDEEPAEAVAERLRRGASPAGESTFAEEQSLAALAQCMEAMWPRLDILVNNAAMLDATPLDQLTRDRFEAVQAVNQNGALWVTLALRPMVAYRQHFETRQV